jgi:hypothetical protein
MDMDGIVWQPHVIHFGTHWNRERRMIEIILEILQLLVLIAILFGLKAHSDSTRTD